MNYHGIMIRIVVLTSLLFCSGCIHCIANDSEDMSSLAAALTKVTKAVEAKVRYDAASAGMVDQELLQIATQHNPILLNPFSGYKLRAVSQNNHAVVLVCDDNGKKALLEDAACTPQMDLYWWDKKPARPCEFSHDLCADKYPH